MMSHDRRGAFTRRRLLRWGAGLLGAGGGLFLTRESRAVPLSGVRATVATATVDVRSGPASTRSRIGGLNRGAVVTCLATSGTWFRITFGTGTGWVSSGNLTLVVTTPAVTVTRGSTAVKAVCLTFDAGDDRGYAASILDTLAAKGIRASFGMTGNWATANGDLVRRIAAEGHHLFNHTLTHRSFTGLSTGRAALTPSERLAELVATESQVVGLTGQSTQPWFRPPYGDYDAGVLRDIAAVGYRQNVMWSLDSLGWTGLSRDQVVARCLASHGNGFIYLLHVGAASQDGPAVAGIIDGLRAKGYGFGTIPEIIAGMAPGGDASATCAVAPSSGNVASKVVITCRGFVSDETVAVHWGQVGSSPIATAKATAAAATLTALVPKDPAGRYTLTAVGGTSGRRAVAEYTLVPSLRLSPVSGLTGAAVNATLRGYPANQTVDIVWRHASSSVTVARVATSYSGSASVGFTVPASHIGGHAVDGIALGGAKAAASFSVAPSVTITPTAGTASTSIQTTLRGFGRYESIRVTWAGPGATNVTIQTIAASATGSAATTFTPPANAAPGPATITATGLTSGAAATRTFDVTPTVSTPTPTPTTTPPPATATPSPTPSAPPTATPVAPTPTVEPTPTITPNPTSTPEPTSAPSDAGTPAA